MKATITQIAGIDLYRLPDANFTNMDVLVREVSNDKTFLKQLGAMLLKAGPESMNAILSAFNNGDFEQVRMAIHRYKGSLQVLGNPAIPNLATRIEDTLRSGTVGPDLSDDLHLLDKLTACIVIELKSWLYQLRTA